MVIEQKFATAQSVAGHLRLMKFLFGDEADAARLELLSAPAEQENATVGLSIEKLREHEIEAQWAEVYERAAKMEAEEAATKQRVW